MSFQWSLEDSNSPQVSRTLLSILANFHNALIEIVSILPLISNCSNPFFKPLETVLSTSTTIDITVTHMFRNCFFFCFSFLKGFWQYPNIFLSFHFLFFVFCKLLERQNPQNKFYHFALSCVSCYCFCWRSFAGVRVTASLQVSRTLLSILTDLSNAVVWVVSARPLISNSSSLITKLPSVPIITSITVTFMFHDFLILWQSSSICLYFRFFLCRPCPVGWGCRIHWLHLCRGVRLHPNECPGYDTKQSDGEVPVMLELRGMQSTPLLPLLPGPLWPGVVAPDRALSMG